MLSNLPITIFTARQKNVQVASLRSKRFRLISEQKNTEERDFRAGFDSRFSFFAPKPAHAGETLTTQAIRWA